MPGLDANDILVRQPFEVLFENGSSSPPPRVTVVIPLYNYERYVADCLESVRLQTLEAFDLIIADDQSKDASADAASRWLRINSSRFRRCLLTRNTINQGLSVTRNRLFELARTELVFPLDPDNTIYPRCLEAEASALEHCNADFAYCYLERFGIESGLVCVRPWNPDALCRGNFIDAMAMIRKATWQRVGGYAADMKLGWEDYEFWLKIAAVRGWGILVPEVLARYRVHLGSMIRTQTHQRESLIWNYLEQKYPHVHRPERPREEISWDEDDVRIHCDRVELLSGSRIRVVGWCFPARVSPRSRPSRAIRSTSSDWPSSAPAAKTSATSPNNFPTGSCAASLSSSMPPRSNAKTSRSHSAP